MIKVKSFSIISITALALSFALTGCGRRVPVPTPDQIITPTVESMTVENMVDSPTVNSEGPSETTDKDDPIEIKLIMVGDVLLHTRIEEVSRQEDGSYDYSAIFANMKDEISSADLALVNQEVIIGGEALGISGYPAFNTAFSLGDELVETGFDVVCHGTNHCLDKGRKGLLNCLDFWNTNYPEMAVLGIHDSQEDAEKIYVYEQGGIRIAILNYTYGTNGIKVPEDMPYAVDCLDKEKVKADIARANEMADFTIVCPHWGTEYVLSPSSYQKEWNKLFLENGVDLVLGTHPHVIEPIEMFTNEKTGDQMLTYYSLGNFVNWTSGTKAGVSNRMVGGMAEVTLTLDENGKVVISDYGVEAIVSHVTSERNGVTVIPLRDYTEELASQNEILSQAPDFSAQYLTELCDSVWGDLWR